MAVATNITTQTVTTLKDERGRLRRIVLNKTTANGVVEVFDATSTGGGATPVATITSPGTLLQNHVSLEYDVETQVGLVVKTSGANQDVTVVWD